MMDVALDLLSLKDSGDWKWEPEALRKDPLLQWGERGALPVAGRSLPGRVP